MARKKKELSIPEIIDKICALEAYEEWLEEQIQRDLFPSKTKEYKNILISTRRQLSVYRNILEVA